jgi:hypothetical protein
MEKRLQQIFENLNQEIETLEAHARRIEALLPNLPPNARQQWEATSTARLVYEEELRKLLNVVLEKSNVKTDPIAGTLD